MDILDARVVVTTNCWLVGDAITTETTVSLLKVMALEVNVFPTASVIVPLTRTLPSACVDKSAVTVQVP